MSIPADAVTRMVLANDGSTTQLLSALLGIPLRVRVLDQRGLPSSQVRPRAAVKALVPGEADEPLVVRKSQLVRPDGKAISINTVIMTSSHLVARSIVDGGGTPLGRVLQGAVEQRRVITETGCRMSEWGGVGRPSVYRSYLVFAGGRPFLHVEEQFHPAIVTPIRDLPLLEEDPRPRPTKARAAHSRQGPEMHTYIGNPRISLPQPPVPARKPAE
ncbi:chorismate pyruvate-lyase family protein [Herbidospora mongoliensis]|uniref:chorismate pyruvate-lyase family protein n=1 Tax=Herbidospora mongoliensis TaxID=688067 RepID=UPI000AB11146|nr:chorismate pyruvate-lyase family protein [Herbidospora mongoliensis]